MKKFFSEGVYNDKKTAAPKYNALPEFN